MKKFFFGMAILGSIASCSEIPLPYDQSKGSLKDTTYVGPVESPQLRNVLVEKVFLKISLTS